MDIQTIENYLNTVSSFSSASELPKELLISTGNNGLSTYYAPFDHINTSAKLVICGITPGLQQANAALSAATSAMSMGQDLSDVLRIAKNTGSFAGVMRNNIVAMLDHIELNKLFKLDSCQSLFSDQSDLVHYTSALRYPVLKGGKNYSGDKQMVNNPYLWDQIVNQLGDEIKQLSEAIWIPLGQSVVNVFEKMISEGYISDKQVLFGLPHASGANAERIKYFIQKKARADLSNKVNPDIIDTRKETLLEKIATLAS
jgi:hypothetical protein